MIRLRNPHGNNREWKGDWSDGDRNWQMIPKHRQTQLGLTFEDDGEFYMSFRDFLLYLGELEICHLTPIAWILTIIGRSLKFSTSTASGVSDLPPEAVVTMETVRYIIFS